jgi:glutaconate CoA-transferase subunit B
MEPDKNGEMVLTAIHPGRTVQAAKENTGWILKTAPELRITEEITGKELEILREELDPAGIYTRGG